MSIFFVGFKPNCSKLVVMGHHLVRACMFCLLCAAHAHCSSHRDMNNTRSNLLSDLNAYSDGGGGGTRDQVAVKRGLKNETDVNSWLDNQPYVKMVFQKFGDGETISIEGFEKLLRAMRLEGLIQTRPQTIFNISEHADSGNATLLKAVNNPKELTAHKCISSESLMGGALVLTPTTYKHVCPVLLSQFLLVDLHTSHHSLSLCPAAHSHSSIHRMNMQDQLQVWLYSTLSIVIISLCGLLGVIVIPFMEKVYYSHIIQYLVALAVGTLCGDALLHLLPHAMMAPEHTHGIDNLDMEEHDTNVYKGLVAMLGVIFFYFTEKCLTLIAEWRKNRQMKNQIRRKVRVVRDTDSCSSSNNTGEKLCKHKYSTYPYCYGEIADNPENHMKNNHCDTIDGSPNTVLTTKDDIVTETDKPFNETYSPDHINRPDLTKENELVGADKRLLDTSTDNHNTDERYTVIIREHESSHHGHSHTHGHVHSAPQSFSSVALMVILGDGLHNFTDGMAIGAAFSSNIAGGFSTALAVFCHELPHELGDFAVLLQAGMSPKQAVIYNLLSSILCLFGMCFGIFLGHSEEATQWVFAAAGGMFLYIALVDMIPELTNSHSYGGAFLQCVLQLAGLMTGTGLMFIIAIYEHDLINVFQD